MAYYYNLPQQTHHANANAAPQHNHHGGRSRRGPRLQAQGAHRPFRGVRSMKELTDAPVFSAFRARFEACKGFELDDDLEFCPGLLTEDDVRSSSSTAASSPPANATQLQSVSSMSDRSSNSSGSPSSSPLQQQVHPQQVSPPFSLAPSFQPAPAFAAQPTSQKIHQPTAVRSHKAIPIVNPSTGMRVASPPNSVSPGRMQQQTYRRW